MEAQGTGAKHRAFLSNLSAHNPCHLLPLFQLDALLQRARTEFSFKIWVLSTFSRSSRLQPCEATHWQTGAFLPIVHFNSTALVHASVRELLSFLLCRGLHKTQQLWGEEYSHPADASALANLLNWSQLSIISSWSENLPSRGLKEKVISFLLRLMKWLTLFLSFRLKWQRFSYQLSGFHRPVNYQKRGVGPVLWYGVGIFSFCSFNVRNEQNNRNLPHYHLREEWKSQH